MCIYEIVLTKHRGQWFWGVDRWNAEGTKSARIADGDDGYLTAALAAEAAERFVCREQKKGG